MIVQPALLATTYALAAAFGLGATIGLERQWRQGTAPLRTNVLVAVGAASFADLGARIAGPDGATRVAAYIVSGIGFLGAGVIMKEGAHVRGLDTAATLWISAAVGAFAGVGFEREAALVTVFVLAGATLLRPVVNFVDRRLMKPHETEALYRAHLVCKPNRSSVKPRETEALARVRLLAYERPQGPRLTHEPALGSTEKSLPSIPVSRPPSSGLAHSPPKWAPAWR